jgi:hypothetical protein
MLLFMLVKFELTKLNLSFDFMSPIFCLLLAVKMIADGRVAFDADDDTPHRGSILVFSFKNRRHSSNLWLGFL